DPNSYLIGIIGYYNIILIYIPGISKVHTAAAASSCRVSFPHIKITLIISIYSITPFKHSSKEIILRDIIISKGII
ncbi:uncharacterized protein FOBCDRAFT_141122, partial [Fusarium oxysporum Fo47]|uniref:uncharacterized protein n=1 Tax=Fusarium oxysporum Fo47 TaxID=660027 RepID=UPI002869A9D6